jgi:CheY-like chemotaxis protein
VLLEAAREQGFKGIVTSQGTAALSMVNEFQPSAILLDIFLPDIEGWRVLSRLKNDLTVRHIPVHVISTEEARDRALDSGARRFVAKPIAEPQGGRRGARTRSTRTPTSGASCCWSSPIRCASPRSAIPRGLENVELIARPTAARRGAPARGQVDCAVVNPDTPELDLAAVMEEVREQRASPPPGDRLRAPPRASVGPRASATLDASRACARCIRSSGCSTRSVLALHLDVPHVKDEHRKVLDDIYGSTKALAGARADRRRRHPQHLRAVVGARGLRHGHHDRRQRPRGDRHRAAAASSTSC